MLLYEMIFGYRLDKDKEKEIVRRPDGKFEPISILGTDGTEFEVVINNIFSRSDRTFVFEKIRHVQPDGFDDDGYVTVRATARPRSLYEGLNDEFESYVTDIMSHFEFASYVKDLRVLASSRYHCMTRYIERIEADAANHVDSDRRGWFSGLNVHVGNILNRPEVSYGDILQRSNGKLVFSNDCDIIEQMDLKSQFEQLDTALDVIESKNNNGKDSEFNNIPLGFISKVKDPNGRSFQFILHDMLFKRRIVPTYDYVDFTVGMKTRTFDHDASRIFIGWFVSVTLTKNLSGSTVKKTIEWIESMTSAGIVVFVDISSLDSSQQNKYVQIMKKYDTSRNWFVFEDIKYTEKEAKAYFKKKAVELYKGTLPNRIKWPKDVSGKTKSELDECFNRTIRLLKYKQYGLNRFNGFLSPDDKSDMMLNDDVENKISAMERLNKLIGLETIKERVSSIVKYNRMYKKYLAAGMKVNRPSYNMVFYGNPGTAKTTCARLIAEIFSEEGIVKSNTFSELTRKDLCGKYVGHTAIKSHKALDDAKGGVIFIDEAYSLTYDDRGVDFGTEAVNEIVASMETVSKDTVFIFAGYEKEMKKFVDSNPGLSSRIPNIIGFPDYDKDELMGILECKFADQGFVIDRHAKKLFEIKINRELKKPNFGNGRFIRNLVEQSIVEHSERLYSATEPSAEELRTIIANDVPDMKGFIEATQQIGFCK